ncbi:MAG: type II secretion system F family protein [Thioalkalispiraceae bacterium]|jgi:MSHA biogenesis protein MshG
MPVFEYKARNAQGQAISGQLDAPSIDAVASQLQNEGSTPLDIQPRAEQKSNPLDDLLARLSRRQPDLNDLILFCRQLYTLMRAGVPIIRSLAGLAETTRNVVLKETLAEIATDLESGHELSIALSHHPKIFTPLFVSMVRVGETTGRMDEAFLQLASYLEREKDTRDQVKTAMRYPKMVVGAITIAMVIINIWVIPTFARVFKGFGAELPLPTQILIGISDFMVAYWYVLLAVLIASIVAFKRYVRTERGEYQYDRYKLRIPLVGSILNRALLARFARAFAMSMKSGVPIVQSLASVARAVDNVYVSGHIDDMRTGIERGDNLTHTAHTTKMFTPLVLQMMAVGEETGAIDEMMEEVADFYDREVDYDLKALSSKIEPILIVIIGVMVMILALGVFLPMWDLMAAAKG